MSDSLTIRELITKWGFAVDDKALDGLDRSLARLQTSVTYVGSLAVGAAASIFGLAKSAANAGDEAKKAAERLGVNVQALQEYQYAADLAGVGADEFQSSLRRLVINLGDARRGSGEAQKNLASLSRSLGYDVVRSGKPAEDLLLDIADAFHASSDATKKASMAQDLFGRGGGRMVNLLNEGSAALKAQRQEARDLGVVMSEEAVQAAEDFNDSLTRGKAALKGLRNVIAIDLFPVLTKLANRFAAYVAKNRELLKLKVEKAIEILSTYLERALYVLDRMVYVVNALVKLFGGWERVIGFVSAAMVFMLGLRFVSFIGSLIGVLGKAVFAFRLLGKAGLLAQAELLLVPLAIGAAFIGLILIIEDVVAYFQGRKSMTGLILNNFEALSARLDEWIAGMLTKVKDFGLGLGRSIVDGIEALQEADWKKIGEFILKVIKLALDLGTIPFQIGMAIAEGIMQGLEEGLKDKHPWLSGLLFNSENAKIKDVGVPAEGTGVMGRIGASIMSGGQGESIGGILIDKAGDLLGAAAGIASQVANSPALQNARLPDPGSFAGSVNRQVYGGGTPINVTAPITINVPEGTPAEAVGPAAQQGVKDSLDTVLRESARATAPAVQY